MNSPIADGAIGGLLMVTGAITFFFGLYRYQRTKSVIREIKQKELTEGIEYEN